MPLMKETAASEALTDEPMNCRRNLIMKNKGMQSSLRTIVICIAALMLTACTDNDKYVLREEAVELYQQGDYQGALEKLDAALSASNGQVSELQYDILKYKAECQLRLGKYDEAEKSYKALLALDEAKENQAEYDEVLKELEALNVINEAVELFNKKDYDGALKLLKPYAALDGTAAGSIAWYNLAVCEEYTGEFDEAKKHFESYVNAYPEDAAANKEYRFCQSRADGTD